MRLYKYRSVNKFSLDILARDHIYFADVGEFNDPFEGRIYPRFPGGAQDVGMLMNHYSSQTFGADIAPYLIDTFLQKGDEHLEIREFVLKQFISGSISLMEMLGNPGPPEFSTIINKMIISTVNNMRGLFSIFTLSEKRNNPLMFSHYSDSHKGFCLEFDLEKDSEFKSQVKKIKYSSKYPDVELSAANILKPPESDELFNAIFLTKSSQWKYEQEWRVIRRTPKGAQPISPNLISGIIFGCRIPYEDLQLILKIIDNRPIRKYRAVLKNQSFGLDVIPFTGS